MEWRNVNNGAVIRTECKLGGAWVPVEPDAQPAPVPKKAPAKKKGTVKK